MSEDRRAYLTKQRLVESAPFTSSPVVPDTSSPLSPLSSSPTPSELSDVYADRDHRSAAYEQVREMAKRDPEAAAFLLEQLEAATASSSQAPTQANASLAALATDDDPRHPFDPMKLYAALAAYYSWSDQEMRRMPMKRLLGYFREMVLRQEREAKQMQDAVAGKDEGASQQLDPDVANAIAEAELTSYIARPIAWPAPVLD